jgi:hypothetical protein
VHAPCFALHTEQSPWLDLFQSLCLHWLGAAPTEGRRQRMRYHQGRAASGGYLWYAREAALLLQSWGDKGDYAADIAALNTKPLLDLHHPEAAWERTLRLLREVSVGAVQTPTAAQGDGELRMVWDVRYEDYGAAHLEPREQKRRGDGWTKGRRVAVARLRDELETFDYLDAQDRAICACIEAEQIGWGWGRTKTEYYLNPVRALRAAVGHPRLLLEGHPVELVQDHPRILVSREKDGIRIVLSPPCEDDFAYTVVPEGNRLPSPPRPTCWRPSPPSPR